MSSKSKQPAQTTSWDPLLLISQIISLQTLHYLTLSILIPPLLTLFAEPHSLDYAGGASSIGMIMDWRELAGRETVRGLLEDGGIGALGRSWAWASGKKVGYSMAGQVRMEGVDPRRGWVIAFCWFVASGADIYYIYYLVKRPRLVLDFTITLLFNHLVGTSYYSSSIPTSGFFWLVMSICAALTIVFAEQLCVRREMREGLDVSGVNQGLLGDEEAEEMELGVRNARVD